MRKNSFLLIAICAMATVLMAGRCSEEEENGGEPASSLPAEGTEVPADGPSGDELKNAESGIDKDPLGGTIGGGDDATAPLEDAPMPEDGDQMFDDPSFEPESVPDEATDL